MTDENMDPGPPAEPGEGSLRAKNLKNAVLVLRPQRYGEEPGKADPKTGEVKPWRYVETDVWVLDRAGIVESGTNVRFSWWRAVPQLQDRIGQFIGCKAVEQDDNSVVLVPLEGEARKVAAQVIADLQAGDDTVEAPPNDEDFG